MITIIIITIIIEYSCKLFLDDNKYIDYDRKQSKPQSVMAKYKND